MESSSLNPRHHLINNQWVEGLGASFHSLNPASNKPFWEGTEATAEEVRIAVNAAQEALTHWRQQSFEARAELCQNFAKVIDAQKETLAQLISIENGKPYWEALTEAGAVIGKVAISIKSYQERTGMQHFEGVAGDTYLRYHAHGVVAVLGAFNFPAHLSNGHIVPALLAGNTVVLKPSELTPAVSQFIMQCWLEAGLPAGVINCIQGGGQTGQYLLEQDIQGVYFTGSYATGKRIHQHFGGRPEVILALEMGGNNPLVVDEVDDIQAAVYNAVLSSMISSGQRCTCARRIIIPDSAKGTQFLDAFVKACNALRADVWDAQPEPFMGPVIRASHAQQHLKAQQALIDKGGEPLLQMRQHNEESALLSPGIIDMSAASNIEDEEVFAPLAQIYRYKDFSEAIQHANQTSYGLSAGLLSDDQEKWQRFITDIRAGIVNWNKPTTGAAGNMPFGGVGCSGNHRPSAYFAADYCAYPVASVESTTLSLPESLMPGIDRNAL